MMNVEAIRAMHEDYIKYECAIHGGTGDNLLYCDGTRAGHDEFAEWIIDGFPALLDELDAVKAERDKAVKDLCDGCKETAVIENIETACSRCHWNKAERTDE